MTDMLVFSPNSGFSMQKVETTGTADDLNRIHKKLVNHYSNET